jgi:hypothetical protein
LNQDWKAYFDLPSLEHRKQIHRFCGSTIPFNDEEDIRMRCYVAFKRWLHTTEAMRATPTVAPGRAKRPHHGSGQPMASQVQTVRIGCPLPFGCTIAKSRRA